LLFPAGNCLLLMLLMMLPVALMTFQNQHRRPRQEHQHSSHRCGSRHRRIDKRQDGGGPAQPAAPIAHDSSVPQASNKALVCFLRLTCLSTSSSSSLYIGLGPPSRLVYLRDVPFFSRRLANSNRRRGGEMEEWETVRGELND